MCGIFGIIRRGGLRPEDRETLGRLARSLVHRGPDGEGFHVSGPVGIGMRRLAIIDLNGGWQPLHNEDRSISLVANGEVYNFVELRKDLESRGHRFRTGSDCETIAHLHEERGADAVNSLRGMFAFALHDERNRRVVIARDRIGEKPLYLVERDGFLAFASEMVALVEAGIVPFEPDPEAVELYYHYSLVPEPLAAIRGVRKLPAGHRLEIELDEWRVRETTWWRMEDSPELRGDPAEAVRATLEEIAGIIFRADVPIGVALSGGIDSSSVLTLAASHVEGARSGRLQAFTIGYPGQTWQDERGMARELADHLGITLHTLELDTQKVADEFPLVCLRRDDPISDISGSSYYAVMRLAREHGVPVMMMGQGGDELFWGYPWCARAVHESERKRRRVEGRAGLSEYLSFRRPPISYTAGLRWLREGGGLLDGLRLWREDAAGDPDELHFQDRTPQFREAERLLPGVAGRGLVVRGRERTARMFRGRQLWDRLDLTVTRLICETYLLGNGIVQGDRLSMAASVEARLPFVDYRLVETVIGLRKGRPDHHQAPKAWLRAALGQIVPDFVFRRPKRGFTPPWRDWTVAIFNRYGRDIPDGELVRCGMLDRKAAIGLSNGLAAGSIPRPLAWQTMVLEQWARGMRSRSARSSAPGGNVVP
jgi:asparagine synthase (glutamine-hydrolysing)